MSLPAFRKRRESVENAWYNLVQSRREDRARAPGPGARIASNDCNTAFASTRAPHVGLRSLRAGRRVRQPRDQPDGAVSQPGDARAGPVLASHAPSLVGHHADPGEHLRALDAARLPDARALRPELDVARLRRRRHLGHHRERRQGAGDVPARPPALAARRRSSSADTSRRFPASSAMLDADHIVKGEGIRWFREFLGEPVDAPIAHPAIPSSFGFRLMGLKAPRGGGDPAATIIPSVGCPMGCNFCTTSSFFGGKGQFVNFYETGAASSSTSCATPSASSSVSTFFMMDENFLLYKKRALELLDADEAARQGVVDVRLLVGQRHPQVRDARARRARRHLGLDGLRVAAARLREAEGHRHDRAHARAAVARHPRPGLDDRRPGAPHARQHPRRDRARGGARRRLPPVHAVHAGAGHAAARRDGGAGPDAGRTSISPTSTVSTSSTSARRHRAATTRSRGSTGRSSATSRSTARASTA